MTTAAGFDETSRTHIFMADIKKGIKKITDTFLYHLVHLHNIWHFKPLAKKATSNCLWKKLPTKFKFIFMKMFWQVPKYPSHNYYVIYPNLIQRPQYTVLVPTVKYKWTLYDIIHTINGFIYSGGILWIMN